MVSLHNLHLYLHLMERVRAELGAGTFPSFRERFVAGYKKFEPSFTNQPDLDSTRQPSE